MVAVLLIITSSYAVLTYRRNFIWKDEFTLWNDAVRKSHEKAISYSGRGIANYQQGNFTQAFSDFNKAIEINPDYFEAYINRGYAYHQQGNFTQAIADYTRAIEINPGDAGVYINRGVVYYLTKEYDKAWADVHKAEGLGYAVNPEFLKQLKKASGREK